VALQGDQQRPVTIPVAIRHLLGIRPYDLVAFDMEGDRVCLRRSEGVVARTAGVFKGCGPTLTAEQLRIAARIAIAEDVAERAGH
jgi:bifunctional DNA-binding transcriptional regulator/antitoxin component of YhaV-PrlF toxin-antitoxin module